MPRPKTRTQDAVILGAGAAGLYAGAELGRRGRRVALLDHAAKPGEKIRISGGGRCNFTNLETRPERFLSDNPHFARSALARHGPEAFLALMGRHGLSWTEKTLGQLFCDQRSGAVVRMLLDELESGGGALVLDAGSAAVEKGPDGFRVETDKGAFAAPALVVATGGLSIPKMGASGFAYDVARRFGHRIVRTRPALVPFIFEGAEKERFSALAGVACPVRASAGGAAFEEAMLFTHRGLSGPAVLQISSYWRENDPVSIDLLLGADALRNAKADHPRRTLGAHLADALPKRLAESLWAEGGLIPPHRAEARLADLSHASLDAVGAALSDWRITPSGTEGWRTAEVTAGGVDTRDLSSRTMESRLVPGLHFIGECVDVTGWLGGYNFQWAWSSAWAAAEAIASSQASPIRIRTESA